MPSLPGLQLITGRSLDRIVNFSDAVVAVAITVLVLPIVAIGGPGPQQTMWQVISSHGGQIGGFLLTFLIVFLLWQGHHRVFDNFIAIDNVIMWLNAGWLASIAFLPWPSKLVDFADQGAHAMWLYNLTLCLNATFLQLIYMRGKRHPGYLRNPSISTSAWSISAMFAVAFAALTLLSIIAPRVAAWSMFLLIPLRFFVQQHPDPPEHSGQSTNTSTEQETP